MLDKDFAHGFTIDGVEMRATIARYSWMYPGQGTGVIATIVATGGEAQRRTEATMDTLTEAAALALVRDIALAKCSRCGAPRFAAAEDQRNRGDLCERCFMRALRGEFQARLESEAAELAARDAEHKADGYTHRVTAWVHPASGGDDHQIDVYVRGAPTATEVAAVLRKQGSAVTDDYTLTAL